MTDHETSIVLTREIIGAYCKARFPEHFREALNEDRLENMLNTLFGGEGRVDDIRLKNCWEMLQIPAEVAAPTVNDVLQWSSENYEEKTVVFQSSASSAPPPAAAPGDDSVYPCEAREQVVPMEASARPAAETSSKEPSWVTADRAREGAVPMDTPPPAADPVDLPAPKAALVAKKDLVTWLMGMSTPIILLALLLGLLLVLVIFSQREATPSVTSAIPPPPPPALAPLPPREIMLICKKGNKLAPYDCKLRESTETAPLRALNCAIAESIPWAPIMVHCRGVTYNSTKTAREIGQGVYAPEMEVKLGRSTP